MSLGRGHRGCGVLERGRASTPAVPVPTEFPTNSSRSPGIYRPGEAARGEPRGCGRIPGGDPHPPPAERRQRRGDGPRAGGGGSGAAAVAAGPCPAPVPCPAPGPLRAWLVPSGPGARPGRGRPGKAAARARRPRTMEGHLERCKIVVVGDTQCGKTALLHVFAKDCYPESYVPTVFENYTASFEIDKQRTELNMWDTSGSAYYDNVRPLAYPDSDAVLICFDISRPETLDSVLKKHH
ncbi:rho-related GTP-binding protein RhoN isoform X2 [Taeniopygia guttata]|uniref:rho-related GTP-binding protein RhoN isoform X2 n=1 Tax=Taeniopygia guttata TaxID=59729 RepID=UPI003BB865D4